MKILNLFYDYFFKNNKGIKEFILKASEIYLINPPRKNIIINFFLLIIAIMLVVFLSFGALTYLFMFIWIPIGYGVFIFYKLYKLHGYSSGLFIIAFLFFLSLIITLKIFFIGG